MRSLWRTLDRDIRTSVAATSVAAAMIGISYGAAVVGAGFPMWMPVVLASTVLAGGSEFLFFGILTAGAGPLAAASAGLLVNARHLPYGLSMPDVFGTGVRRLLGVHLMVDESVAFALAPGDLERRRSAYWLCGLGIAVCWPLGALAGAVIGSIVPDTAAFGLDAVFPAVLLALILPALRDRATLRAAGVGAGIAVLTTPFVPAGLPVLLALAGLIFALGAL
ncbi:AzlC family ABC transporter permease [Nocardia cyriacigeorgica]|uniref:AzlC family ABC transporter permease n=1 Tax=Nocardia cyriacigeorgica TaxID=135487 RepID=UPI0018945967|nr:AzlC family ABC transporter permease [Nocardia cyriacigeorgica]MBF6097853.1 AzlC family ABC transporter permease [Nocardia cyriacigeorgica]MBF6158091.1 AzlC family ABC transporter permease [Nocardia cyriacigeorgica]MBF6197063.1 AzlC family ABC transporter permease [Nocardia cyriacigeorgica]MBF6317667.1 AzlC family ABC transporter permease [Nocardia cyriacigeorgica]MBF6533141.1 AzlC family ABC transporter permease [Nocardia cyriacigeorgica]